MTSSVPGRLVSLMHEGGTSVPVRGLWGAYKAHGEQHAGGAWPAQGRYMYTQRHGGSAWL